MEVELKYLLRDRKQADDVFADPMVKDIACEGTFETIGMDAVYYDTPGRKLTEAGIAVRVRKEGGSYVATMKDKGSSAAGMHRRTEVNVDLDDSYDTAHPDISIFRGSEVYDRLCDAAGSEELVPVLEMAFERRQVKVDTGKSVSVLSCDDGEIKAAGRSLPIMELEIELVSGDEADLIEYGKKIAEKYGLKAEDRSKFARGYDLLR